ncbi:putative phospholipase B-like 2 [Varanus komodoensis]|nr:putative phospholipase B-like 2 [Varanus komodoensis]
MALLRFLLLSLPALLRAGPPPPFPAAGAEPTRSCSVLLDPLSARLQVVSGWAPGAVAWANLTDAIRETGWAFLELTTNDKYNDSIQAYAAGLAEAAVSDQLIYMHWMNIMVGYCGPFSYQTEYCQKLRNYLEANLDWMQEQIEAAPGSEYWHQIRLALLQLKGLEDGYNGQVAFPTGQFSIAPFGFLLFQLGGDLEDLEPAFNKSDRQRVLGSGSCSALIKLLPGNQDLLVSHDTWTTYQSMLRILKKYTLPFRTSAHSDSTVFGYVQAFSSYPGRIFSGDDFYIMSSGLVTLETTIGNLNASRWKYVQAEGSVLEWLRNLVANRLAKSGAEWAAIFQQFNSGTYNNQWMIVDYKAFIPGRAGLQEGVLTILEQIPGMVITQDKTKELYQESYWASYNVPYFKEIFNASGLPEMVEKYGDWFTYEKSPRAQIFRRNQTLVRDVASMIRLMRFNNFPKDPLSRCQACDPPQNGENAIAARSDLNPANGTYPFGALQQRPHGSIDMKVAFLLARDSVAEEHPDLKRFRAPVERSGTPVLICCVLKLFLPHGQQGSYEAHWVTLGQSQLLSPTYLVGLLLERRQSREEDVNCSEFIDVVFKPVAVMRTRCLCLVILPFFKNPNLGIRSLCDGASDSECWASRVAQTLCPVSGSSLWSRGFAQVGPPILLHVGLWRSLLLLGRCRWRLAEPELSLLQACSLGTTQLPPWSWAHAERTLGWPFFVPVECLGCSRTPVYVGEILTALGSGHFYRDMVICPESVEEIKPCHAVERESAVLTLALFSQVTSYEMAKNLSLIATSGPTWDDLPAFQWSSSPYRNLLHMGHPDLWQFPPIQVCWD